MNKKLEKKHREKERETHRDTRNNFFRNFKRENFHTYGTHRHAQSQTGITMNSWKLILLQALIVGLVTSGKRHHTVFFILNYILLHFTIASPTTTTTRTNRKIITKIKKNRENSRWKETKLYVLIYLNYIDMCVCTVLRSLFLSPPEQNKIREL